MADCKHDCEKPPVFPLPIYNRPALENIDYRIGSYACMREHMLDQLNQDLTLQKWTHRGTDDPGIALLEANALIGDVLAFYQNLYANEAFLRTAEWQESVAELVQLTGYRLAPGVGGEATFALKIKGDNAVTVPAGFGFKAQLRDRDQQDEFESSGQITAYPHLSEFNLYTPANAMPNISKGETQLELHAVDDDQALADLQSVEFNKGDRIMLVPDSDMFDTTGASYVTQAKPEILIVSSVETVLNRIVISFEGALRIDRGANVRAYKIDRSFRHFGYNASSQYTDYDLDDGTITDVKLRSTNFGRYVSGNHPGSDYYTSFTKEQVPLDLEVDDLALGGKLICQGVADFEDHTGSSTVSLDEQHFVVVKTIEEIGVDNFRWANIDASVTVVNIDAKMMTNDDLWYERTDIRRTQFHEVTSPRLTLRAVSDFPNGSFGDGKLEFFGTYQQAQALATRDLLLVDNDAAVVQAVKTSSTLGDFETQLASRDSSDKWMWNVMLDQFPRFSRESFSQQQPVITVYGNPIKTDQGKTEDQVVLGSGDSRQTFQTLAIPKAPLTYLLDESQTPAQVPELDIYVDDILWNKVDTFFNSVADDQVYVVREDHDGNSLVQFGDGITGARLPSGINNVVAVYRTGIGATGLLEVDKKPSASGKLVQLERVFLPGEVVGGGEAESLENAREVAPAKMQSLGRLVGLADFEAEALALPGVDKVRADWTAPYGTPLIRLVVLTETSTTAAVEKVQTTLNGYNRCRGPARYPIVVKQGLLQYIYLQLRVGYAASYRQANIESGVKLALGQIGEENSGIETDDGLFSLALRYFGQGVHRSQILAAVQQVDGVTWVEIDDAQAIDLGTPAETDPDALGNPATASTVKVVACLPERILALHANHLDLSLVQDATEKECE